MKKETKILCVELHLAAITEDQNKDNSRMDLVGSRCENRKKAGASALEWRMFDLPGLEWASINICWMNDWLVLHSAKEESRILLHWFIWELNMLKVVHYSRYCPQNQPQQHHLRTRYKYRISGLSPDLPRMGRLVRFPGGFYAHWSWRSAPKLDNIRAEAHTMVREQVRIKTKRRKCKEKFKLYVNQE